MIEHEWLTGGTLTVAVLRKLAGYRQRVKAGSGRHRSMLQTQMALGELLDLRTGELPDHDPDFLSWQQIPRTVESGHDLPDL